MILANLSPDPKHSSVTDTARQPPSSSTAIVSAVVPSGGSSTPNPSIAVSPNPSSSPANPNPQGALQRNNKGAIAGGVVGALLLLLLVFMTWIIFKRRRKNSTVSSANYLPNPASYPFARAGFGGTANMGEKTGNNNNYGGAGQGAGGQARFTALSMDSREGISNEESSPPMRETLRDQNLVDPLPPPPQPEILYSTPLRVASPPALPATTSNLGTHPTPNRRRVPFGTGTFQFPPRPPQPPSPQ